MPQAKECCDGDCNQGRNCPNHKEINVKSFFERLKGVWVVALVLFALGGALGQASAYATILVDCKVLGMFRFGLTPVDCRVGTKTV